MKIIIALLFSLIASADNFELIQEMRRQRRMQEFDADARKQQEQAARFNLCLSKMISESNAKKIKITEPDQMWDYLGACCLANGCADHALMLRRNARKD